MKSRMIRRIKNKKGVITPFNLKRNKVFQKGELLWEK